MLTKRLMPKWQWEVCKMFLYMSFPVMCFHYFNTPQIFEEEVTKVKQKHYPPISIEKRKEIEDLIRDVNAERELQALKTMESAQEMKQSAFA